MALRREANAEAAVAYEERKARVAAERAADKIPATYVYSGQKLQYTELKKAEQRARLRNERNVLFVRSSDAHADYLSLTVPLVDETRLKQDAAAESKAKWKTKRGFVYPAPKPPAEYNVHPKKPSEARVVELNEEWVENEFQATDLGRSDDPSLRVDPARDFDTIPSNGAMEFGGLRRPKFEREYDGSHLGDITRLPRGAILQDKYGDTEYLRSVHLCGEGLAAEAAETKRKEEALFRSKVVVDSLDFKVGNFLQIDRPSQTDRNKEILHGPVKSRALKIVRNAKLPSGKSVKLRPPPYSMFSQGEYVEAHDFAEDLRQYPGEFTAKTETGDPLDFQTHIHRDVLRRASEKILSRKAIQPTTSAEIQDDCRWHPASRGLQGLEG